MNRRRLHATAAIASVTIGCSLFISTHAMSPAPSGGRYEATIRRTSYGIPHISAKDEGGLAFGDGYASAQDHLCSIADAVVLARGERAKFFGAGVKDAHLQSDISVKALRIGELAAADIKRAGAERRERLTGYAAGFNTYLAEVGVDGVAGWCRGAAWVRPITAEDVAARARLVTALAFASMIATAAPPKAGTVVPQVEMPDLDPGLSNGWAIGKERSETGRGMLLANPHYPWVGTNRFWEKHLTIPGRLDVYGVTLLGAPGVAIGFNRHVAWTHTVSAGARFTAYALQLVPGSPTSYVYDAQPRPMIARDVQVEVRQADGSLKTVTRTVYFSHHGPVVNFPGLPWTMTRAIAIRDANANNDRGFETHDALARAKTLEDVKRAHALGGMGFVNTMVATADGRAFYIDASAAPHLPEAAIKWWTNQVELEGDVKTAYGRRVFLLDGSASTFEWVNDPRAAIPGNVPAELAPQLERSDYVFNANDSHWVSHARVRLTGFSPVHGHEETVRSLRTRMNALLLDDSSQNGPSGRDGRFSLDELWTAVFSNRSMSEELLRGEVLQRCKATPSVTIDNTPVALDDACRVLAAWDGGFDLDSRGAVLWRELITQIPAAQMASLFATPFTTADPIGTPRGLAPARDGRDMALDALGRAAQILERAGLPLHVPLGQVQFAQRGSRRVPVHGGLGGPEGIANFVAYGPNTTTLEPDPPIAPVVDGSRLLRRDGYPINNGSSFVMALTFTDAGPRARAVLTYGQSGDPASPHFSDQTELFSRKGWREILFTEKEIAADKGLRTKVVSGPRLK
jgi:acyl-homoserine-lactone acylase